MTRTGVRIETMTGGGFFSSAYPNELYDLCYEIEERHDYNFPSYHTDTELSQNIKDEGVVLSDYYFAYPTLEVFLKGFTAEELNTLVRSDFYRIVFIIANDTFTSEHQIVYRPSSVISTTDISDLFLINETN